MPNALLARYFAVRAVFREFDFAAMCETRHDELFAAWLALPEAQHNTMDAEFRDIFEMSCEKGCRAILDETQWHLAQDADPNAAIAFAGKLAALVNHFERAMVTYLDHNLFWRGARHFYHADSLPHWRKRKNLPHSAASVDAASIRRWPTASAPIFTTPRAGATTAWWSPFAGATSITSLPTRKTIRNKAPSGSTDSLAFARTTRRLRGSQRQNFEPTGLTSKYRPLSSLSFAGLSPSLAFPMLPKLPPTGASWQYRPLDAKKQKPRKP